MLLFFLVVASFSTLIPCPHCPLFVSAPCLLAHVLPVLTHPPTCAFQFVSPPHSLTSSAPCPDLPTHLCLPVCESPLLTRSLVLLCVLTCPPICAFQFVSPPHLLHVLTYPLICAFWFVSPPCSLTC